jgi:palmitoyltransferase
VLLCPTFIDIPSNLEMLGFWLDVAIVLAIYFYCHWQDPGYVPFDAIFFTEQEEQSCRSEVKMRALAISHLKIDISGSIDKSPSEKRILNVPPNSIKDRLPSLSDRPEKNGKITRYQFQNNGEVAGFKGSISERINVNLEFDKLFRDDVAAPHSNSPKLEHDIEESKNEDESVAQCEPSMEIELSFMNSETNGNLEGPLSPKLGDQLNQLDDKEDDDPERVKLDTLPKNLMSTNVTQQEKHGSQTQKFTTGVGTKHSDHNIMLNQSIDDIKKSPPVPVTLNTSCNVRSQTDDDNSKLIKLEELSSRPQLYHQLNEEETARNDSLAKNPIKKKTEINSLYLQKKELDTTCDHLDPPGSERGSAQKGVLNEIKIMAAKDSKPKNESVKMDERLSSEEYNKNNSNGGDDAVYVERRYCTVCNIEQPIRAKHCKTCQRCCASYDHHCPWLGTCIGEKNHLPFYIYLFFQFIEVLWADYELIIYMINHPDETVIARTIFRIALIVVASFFVLMVGSLFSYHSYLASVNLTTWESLSWHKISYLKEWPTHMGSPFSNGVKKNLAYFCCTVKSELQRWRLPKLKKKQSSPVLAP